MSLSQWVKTWQFRYVTAMCAAGSAFGAAGANGKYWAAVPLAAAIMVIGGRVRVLTTRDWLEGCQATSND